MIMTDIVLFQIFVGDIKIECVVIQGALWLIVISQSI